MSKKSKKKQHTSNLKKERIQRLLNLGTQFHIDKNIKQAEAAYRQIIEADPLHFRALYLLAVLYSDVGNYKGAVDFMRLAIQVNPNYSLAHNDLGVILQQMGDTKGAMECYKKALELNKNFSEAQNNMGVIYGSKGNAEKSRECFEKAMAINPYYFDASNNYIFVLDLSPEETVQSLINARKQWSEVHETPLLDKQKPLLNTLTTNRKIRVGYVSADFRLHSASFVFGGMLTEFDRDKFEVYAYNNSNSKSDSRTIKFKESVTAWKEIFGFTDEQLAGEIRKDRIDILVDLTGYSSGSRLLAFARKPAPLQVCAWGYATSTGMKSMDYFFADNVIVPPEEKDLYVEDVVYLPNVVTHYCPEDKPEVAELPALKNSYITFGSFNRLAKVSEEAFRLWVRVLQSVPNSRMVLKISELGDIGVQEWALKNFEAGGITRDRIIFLDKKPWYYHMGDFNQIDLGLDPYPHGGGVTTLESLAMGVPVITLKWPTIVGRLSTSILTTLGMTDWVAETKEDYIRIAVEKAKDLQTLSDTRNGLRTKLESSIIGDYKTYTKEVENEYLKMWEKYVVQNQTR